MLLYRGQKQSYLAEFGGGKYLNQKFGHTNASLFHFQTLKMRKGFIVMLICNNFAIFHAFRRITY